MIQLTFSTHSNRVALSKLQNPPFLTLCFVVQMAKSVQLHYLDMLPLPHASEDDLDELGDVQMNVGDLVRVAANMGSPAPNQPGVNPMICLVAVSYDTLYATSLFSVQVSVLWSRSGLRGLGLQHFRILHMHQGIY